MYSAQAEELWRYLGVSLKGTERTSPLKLSRVAELFRIKIGHTVFDGDISGMLIRSKKGIYIYLNTLHHYNRRRFSLGHELGHYYLNHPADVSTLLDDDRNSPIEKQANRFSSCLLMPECLVHSLAQQNMTIHEIASWARVSPIAAAFRCRGLGYRTWEAEDIISEYWSEQAEYRDDDDLYMEQVAVTMEQ